MEVILGKTSGFCPGITNAVETTKKILEQTKQNIYCLGDLTHNAQVIEKLGKMGLITIENVEEAKSKVIFRSHGVEKKVYEKAKQLGLEIIDLTCPKVLRIHKLAEEYTNKGYHIVYIGEGKHPEVIGTLSFCENNYSLIEQEDDVEKVIQDIINKKYNKIVILEQTTFHLEKYNNIIQKLQKQLPKNVELVIEETICNATHIRQNETTKISKEVDYMIIIGGKKSSNTYKLYEIAKANCTNAILVQTKEDLPIEEIKKYNKIGIMAGASTPKESIEDIIEVLEKEERV